MNTGQENKKVMTTEVSFRTSWREKLIDLTIGSSMLVDMRSSITVRHLISAKMPIYNPEMSFTTKKININIEGKNTSVVEVTRVR